MSAEVGSIGNASSLETGALPASPAAAWYHEAEGVLVPCEAGLSEALEDAFVAYWESDLAPTRAVSLGPFGSADFRTMVLVPSSGGAQQPLFRQELPATGAAAGCHTFAQSVPTTIEWGHGQNVMKGGRAFAPYSAEVSLLLEDTFQQFLANRRLKGVMFTSSNDADYLVDFARMTQLRLDTRNVRPVYRHKVSLSIRGSGGVPSPSLSRAPSSFSERSVPSRNASGKLPEAASAACSSTSAVPTASNAKAKALDCVVSGLPRPLVQARAQNPPEGGAGDADGLGTGREPDTAVQPAVPPTREASDHTYGSAAAGTGPSATAAGVAKKTELCKAARRDAHGDTVCCIDVADLLNALRSPFLGVRGKHTSMG